MQIQNGHVFVCYYAIVAIVMKLIMKILYIL